MDLRAQIRPAIVSLLLFTLLIGVFYPLLITGIAQLLLSQQANGSLILHNGQVVGSELIGQSFTNPLYFWGRPSSTAGYSYNALDLNALTGSSGSNLGPLSQTLVDTVRERVEILHTLDPDNSLPIPADLVTSSASGLDPDISVAAAYYQVPRVARARDMSENALRNLVDQYTTSRQLGFLGDPHVNVMRLNLALDEIK